MIDTSANFGYILDNFKDIWEAMCELNTTLPSACEKIAQDPQVKTLLFLDGMTEVQYYNRIRMGLVLLESSLGSKATAWALTQPPSSYMAPLTFTIEAAASQNLENQSISFPVSINVAGSVCMELSPTDPTAIYDVVFERLNLSPDAVQFIEENVLVMTPTIH